jgi:hypothetical protein
MAFFNLKNQEVFNRAISSLLKWEKNLKKYDKKKTKNWSKSQSYRFRFKKKEYTGIIRINRNFSKKKTQTFPDSILKIGNIKQKILKKALSIKKKNCLKTSKFRKLKFYIDFLFFIFRSLI